MLGLLCSSATWSAPEDDGGLNLPTDKGLMTQITGQLNMAKDKASEQASGMVLQAMNLLGVPYRRGGNTESSGFDCSGFVRAIYEQTVGLVLPRKADDQAAATQVIDRKDLKPGDLVFFNTMRRAFSHVGIYVGEGKFIHSPKPGAEVRVEDMSGSYWRRRFDGARRVVEGDTTPVAETATERR